MKEKAFHLEIVTPQKTIFSSEVLSFSAPGLVGGFQVLKSHAPLVSSIAIGEVKLSDVSGVEQKFATSGGFVEVHDNKVIMLAETAERSDQIDVQRAEGAQKRAQKLLVSEEKDVDIDRARIALARAMNRLRIARR